MWHAHWGNCLSSCLVLCVFASVCLGIVQPSLLSPGNSHVNTSRLSILLVCVYLKFQLNIKGLSMSLWLNCFPNLVFTFAPPSFTYNTALGHGMYSTLIWWDTLLYKRNGFGYRFITHVIYSVKLHQSKSSPKQLICCVFLILRVDIKYKIQPLRTNTNKWDLCVHLYSNCVNTPISPHGCCAAEWRHMAVYVSSYPTLWSVSDMLSLSRQKGSRTQRERREAEIKKKLGWPRSFQCHIHCNFCPHCDL